MRLILIRHGQTDDNVRRVMQGQEGAPLNEEGFEQARRVGERFAHEQIDVLVSSPQIRAMQTAMIIARNHAHLYPIPMALLQERHAGETSGMTYEAFGDLATTDPGGHIGYRPMGGESMIDTSRRAQAWHYQMTKQWSGYTVLAVSHGGFIRAYLGWLKHGLVDERSWDYKHENTGVSIVDLSGARPKVRQINDISHLQS